MPAFLVLLFVVVPLVELAVILQVGQLIGPWWTIALLVLFSIVGAALLRHEGRRAWQAFRAALEQGRWPGDEVTQGALVIVGGTLLLTPGFVTDAVGFLLLLPPSRALASRIVRARLTPQPVRLFGSARTGRRDGRTASGSGATLDVEVVDIERESPAPESGREDGDEDDAGSGEALGPGGRPG